MKAAVVTRYGGPDTIEIRDVPVPRPRPDQVLVRVKSFALNFADVAARWGVYPGTPRPPFVPGIEFSGEVVAVGEHVRRLCGGERVMGYSKSGCHAQYVAVDERLCGVLPASMTFEEAAAFPVASMTAYHALVHLAGIRRGERLLIHAAAGGVGTAVIQIAKDIGVEVFATAGTDEKLSVARAQGADHVINYRTMNFASRVREISGGYGVDVVVDPVGGRVFRSGWNLLAGMGRYVLLGLSSVSGPGRLNFPRALWILGSMGVLVPARVLSSNRAFLAFNLGTLTGREEYLHDTGLELLRLYERRVLRPVIGQVLPFSDVARAHRMLQTGQTLGKVVITFDESRPVPEARNDSAHA